MTDSSIAFWKSGRRPPPCCDRLPADRHRAYRSQAKKLREWAERTTAIDIRHEILNVADDCEKLAASVERAENRK
jgi:hypothetical protein